MKYILVFFSLFSAVILIVTACKALSDVHPIDIYSPIDLSKGYIIRAALPGIYNKDGQDQLNIEYTINDELFNGGRLNFGVVVFYDSLSPKFFFNNKNATSQELPNFYNSSLTTGKPSRKTIEFTVNRNFGNIAYILPVAIYNRTKILYSKSFIKLNINSWNYFSTIPSSFITSENEKILAIQGVSGGKPLISESINGTNSWRSRTSNLNLLPTIKGHNLDGTENTNEKQIDVNYDYIYTFFDGNLHHWLVSTSTNKLSTIGDLILDRNFNIIDYIIFKESNNFLKFTHASYQDDTLNYIVSEALEPSPLLKNLSGGSIKVSKLNQFKQFYLGNIYEDLKIALIFKNYIILKFNNSNYFEYNLNSGVIKTSDLKAPLWESLSSVERYITISTKEVAYLLNGNINMYKFFADKSGNPTVEELDVKWFPALSSKSFIQGIVYGKKLAFTVNDNQIWTLDIQKPNIDFNDSSNSTLMDLY